MSDRERRRVRSRERRHGSRRSYTPSPEAGVRREMREMLLRLRALEERSMASPARRSRSRDRRASRSHGRRHERSCTRTPPLPPPPPPPRSCVGASQRPPPSGVSCPGADPSPYGASCAGTVPPRPHTAGAGASEASAPSMQQGTTTDRIVEAIRSINMAQSTGKLDSGMRGPYRVRRVLPHGRYELQLLAGSYGKTTQAAAEYMIPWRGEWTPEVCSAYFEGADSEDEGSTSAVNELPSGAQPRAAAEPQSAATEPQSDAVESLPVAGSSSVPDAPLPPVDPSSPSGQELTPPVTVPAAESRPAASMPLLDTDLTS